MRYRFCAECEQQWGSNACTDRYCQWLQASKEMDFVHPLDLTSSGIPIRIHAIRDGEIATFESVKWVAERCYGGHGCITEETNYHSHAAMTFLGGPIRIPTLLQNCGVLGTPERHHD